MVTEIFLGNLTKLIAQRGISKNALADAIGVHQTTISSWYARKTIPAGDVIDRLSEFFEIEPAELFVRDIELAAKDFKENDNYDKFPKVDLGILGFGHLRNDYLRPLGRVLPGLPYIIIDQLKALEINDEEDKTALLIAILLQYFVHKKGKKTFFDKEYSGEHEEDNEELSLRKKQLARIACEIAGLPFPSSTSNNSLAEKLALLSPIEIELIESSINGLIAEKKKNKSVS